MLKLLCGPLALVALGAGPGPAQPTRFDFNKLQVSQLTAAASQRQVAQRLGQPQAVVEPHYECGQFSSQQEGKKFYELRYRQAVFIGNKQQGYVLYSFNCRPAGPAALLYGRHPLSTATTLAEFTRLFGKLETYQNKDGSVEVVMREQDASGSFLFRAGRLVSYAYHGMGC